MIEIITERKVKDRGYREMRLYDLNIFVDSRLVVEDKIQFPVKAYMHLVKTFGYVLNYSPYYVTYMVRFNTKDWVKYARSTVNVTRIGDFAFITLPTDEWAEFRINGRNYRFQDGVFTPLEELVSV